MVLAMLADVDGAVAALGGGGGIRISVWVDDDDDVFGSPRLL